MATDHVYEQALIEQLKEQRNRLLPIAGQFPRMVVATDDDRERKGHIYAEILGCVDLIDEWLDALEPDWREDNPL